MLLRAFVLLLWIGVASGLALPRAVVRMSTSAAPPPATSPAERAFFDGRVCWVTGASSGIGRATSVALAAAGARVILSARREDALRAVAAECAAVGPTGDESCVAVLLLDLDAPAPTLRARADAAAALFGAPVDLLVNNGGVSTRGRAEDTTSDVDEMIMRVNFMSAVALTKAVLPPMLERRRGDVVVVSSVQGRLAIPLRAAYAASKHALHGYFESLRAEVADRDVNVLIVCPGYVNTALSRNALTARGDAYGKTDETTAAGLDPALVAAEILRGVVAREHESVLADFKSRVAIVLRALWPDVLVGIMKSRYLKEAPKLQEAASTAAGTERDES